MTTTAKPVKRETLATYRNRPIIVELHQTYLIVRLKGTRQRLQLEYRACLDLAWKLLARQEREEKLAKRRARHGC
jgi:hypothetical protein